MPPAIWSSAVCSDRSAGPTGAGHRANLRVQSEGTPSFQNMNAGSLRTPLARFWKIGNPRMPARVANRVEMAGLPPVAPDAIDRPAEAATIGSLRVNVL